MNLWQRIAVAPVLATAMFATVPAFAGNNSDQPVTDTWITTKVKSELATTSDVKSMAMTGDADWDALDSNKDGFLTKDELTGSPALVHNFDKIDTDKDGKISMDEWKSYGKNKK